MKKTLSLLAILGFVSAIGVQSANAFSWSNMNPAYWGHCPKCEKKKSDCGCKKQKKCNPCEKTIKPCDPCTGAAAPAQTPCDPCAKKTTPCPCQKQIPQQKTCDPCDRLQEMSK